LGIHRKYSDLVNKAFSGDAGFVASLDKACREFVNRNSVCLKNSAKSPELLARFCDTLLRKGPKTPEEQELEEVLKNVVRCSTMLFSCFLNLKNVDDRVQIR